MNETSLWKQSHIHLHKYYTDQCFGFVLVIDAITLFFLLFYFILFLFRLFNSIQFNSNNLHFATYTHSQRLLLLLLFFVALELKKLSTTIKLYFIWMWCEQPRKMKHTRRRHYFINFFWMCASDFDIFNHLNISLEPIISIDSGAQLECNLIGSAYIAPSSFRY